MKKNKLVAPFVKWVGGKRQLIGALSELLPSEGLIDELSHFVNEPEIFYAVRSWDRDKAKYSSLTDIQRAG